MRFSISLPAALDANLQKRAAEMGFDKNQVIVLLLRRFWDKIDVVYKDCGSASPNESPGPEADVGATSQGHAREVIEERHRLVK